MLYMWREEKGKPIYRFQTDEKALADKMRRREKFRIISKGFNCKLWIFGATFSRPDIARKTFKALTGQNAIFNEREDIFQCPCILSNSENSAA